MIDLEYKYLDEEKRKIENMEMIVKKREEILEAKENMRKQGRKFDPEEALKTIKNQNNLIGMEIIKAMIETNTDRVSKISKKERKTPNKGIKVEGQQSGESYEHKSEKRQKSQKKHKEKSPNEKPIWARTSVQSADGR